MSAATRGRTWREADLRGAPETRPPSVRAVVRHARRGLAAARWGESVLFAATAAFLTLASAVVAGAPRSAPDTLLVAALAGLLAGASWRLEHRLDARTVARRLDRRLRYQGALVTAYELEERRGALAGLEELVRRRVLARLRPREALRAVLPSLVLPIAAPVVAAGTLALVLEGARPDPAGAVDVAGLARGVVDTLGALGPDALAAGEAGALDPATVEGLLDAQDRAQDLERRTALGEGAASPAEARALERDLAALARRLGDAPELRARIEAARAYVDAARAGLEAAAGAAGGSEAVRGESGAGEGPGEGPGGMTGGSPEGMMVGSPPRAGDPPGVSDPLPRAERSGVQRSWPAGYDELVHRWVEARRRALEDG